jgi:serine/threonine protein kinase/tetratricopeptide (TPR) repeat protein
VIGQQISHFYVIRSLGSGGMGVVYEAQDTRLPRSVAIKFLKPAFAKDIDAVRRFKREARLASSLNHPNICTVLDVAEGDGQPFIAMELLQGVSLRERLAKRPMTLAEILAVGIQIVDGLATAHDRGIMHRDITPRNIFITEDGFAKLLDFGLAKQFAAVEDADSLSEDLTQTGAVVGTIHYMAPELLIEGATVDHRCDLFSVGAVLYQMATGARPFEAKSKQDVMDLIQKQPHVPLRRLAPHHPVRLERIVDKLLAKWPDDRYGNAWKLGADLEALQQQSVRRLKPPAKGRDNARPAIAVLPFRAIGRSGTEAGETGPRLAEAIVNQLSQHRSLHVVPTSDCGQMVESMRGLGARLGVRTILEGSVQRSGDRVRVIANLIDASAERPVIPAIRIERQGDDVQSIESNLSCEVATRVAAFLTRSHDRSSTEDPEAFSAFKRGLHHWEARFSGGWRPAIEQFQYAVERDSGFALAHVALASAYEFLGFHCLMKPTLAFSVAQQSIERALEIDDTLAAAHTEQALIRFGGDWDWDGSERAFRRALQLDSGNPLAHVCYSWLLMLLGREDAAFAEAKVGHDLAPDSRFAMSGRAQTLYLACRYDEAIELCTACLGSDPNYIFARSLRGQCYEQKSMFEEAVADIEQAVALTDRAPFYVGILGHCYGRAGMSSNALALLDDLNRQSLETYVPPQCYVYIHAGLGERVKALEYQEKAYEDGASPFNYLVPIIRDLYALDPQQKRRLEQMRLIL